jgi:hypothetical protein
MDIKLDNHTVETKRQTDWMSPNLKVKTNILAFDLTGHILAFDLTGRTTQNAQEVVKVRIGDSTNNKVKH